MSSIVALFHRDIVLKGCLVCTVFLFSACASASKQETIRLEQAQVYSDINQLLGDNACSTAVDCGVLPIGRKACGGPASYLAYGKSIGEDKISELKQLADRTRELDQTLNQENGLMSTCVFLSEPALVCANSRCATSEESVNSIGIKTEIQ